MGKLGHPFSPTSQAQPKCRQLRLTQFLLIPMPPLRRHLLIFDIFFHCRWNETGSMANYSIFLCIGSWWFKISLKSPCIFWMLPWPWLVHAMSVTSMVVLFLSSWIILCSSLTPCSILWIRAIVRNLAFKSEYSPIFCSLNWSLTFTNFLLNFFYSCRNIFSCIVTLWMSLCSSSLHSEAEREPFEVVWSSLCDEWLVGHNRFCILNIKG